MALIHPPIWQLQEAKNRFSEVINAAEHEGPQTITRHGKPVAVVVPVLGNDSQGLSISAWDLLRDDLVAALGGAPDTTPRSVDPEQTISLPW